MGKKIWEQDDFFVNLSELNFDGFKNLERTDYFEDTQLCFNLYGKFAKYITTLTGLDKNEDFLFDSNIEKFSNYDTSYQLPEKVYDFIEDKKVYSGLDDIYMFPKGLLDEPLDDYSFYIEDSKRIICTKYGIITSFYDTSQFTYGFIHLATWSKEGIEILKDFISSNLEVSIRYEKNYSIVYEDQGRFSRRQLPIKDVEIDISANYDDGFDYDTLLDVSTGEDTSFVMLHGKPGTGKTYLIRQLMSDLTSEGVEILYFDPSVFTSFSNPSFFEFLLSHRNSVIIMEDCERALMSRDSTNNPIMNTLLNLTDGIVGESLNLHFVCTFNTDLGNIDKALLRKGRLTYIHEFKELSLEQTRKHIPEATKPMTIGDIYNNQKDNGYSNKIKIGFNQ